MIEQPTARNAKTRIDLAVGMRGGTVAILRASAMLDTAPRTDRTDGGGGVSHGHYSTPLAGSQSEPLCLSQANGLLTRSHKTPSGNRRTACRPLAYSTVGRTLGKQVRSPSQPRFTSSSRAFAANHFVHAASYAPPDWPRASCSACSAAWKASTKVQTEAAASQQCCSSSLRLDNSPISFSRWLSLTLDSTHPFAFLAK